MVHQVSGLEHQRGVRAGLDQYVGVYPHRGAHTVCLEARVKYPVEAPEASVLLS